MDKKTFIQTFIASYVGSLMTRGGIPNKVEFSYLKEAIDFANETWVHLQGTAYPTQEVQNYTSEEKLVPEGKSYQYILGWKQAAKSPEKQTGNPYPVGSIQYKDFNLGFADRNKKLL